MPLNAHIMMAAFLKMASASLMYAVTLCFVSTFAMAGRGVQILIKIICFIKRNSYPSCFFNDEDNPILIIVKTITICQIAVTKRSHHSQKGAEDTRNSRICKCQFC